LRRPAAPAAILLSVLLTGAGAAVAADDGGAGDADAPLDAGVPDAAPAPDLSAPPPPPAETARQPEAQSARIEAVTVVGTRESRTAGSAHVLRSRDLERFNQDNPETVVKSVPGVYARGEDGVGLRPNIGIRGTNPDRSKKVTLMEDGILFGPAPYAAPAAYYFPLITRMEAVRVIKGPGAVSFGPQTVGGALDLVTRRIPENLTAGIDLAGGQYSYGKAHGHFGAGVGPVGFVVEGVHLRSAGFKELDGGGDTGYARNEWMWKGRYRLPTDSRQDLQLKLGYSDESSRETYLGLTDADFRANRLRRYRASAQDAMGWHRIQLAATYHAELPRGLTLDAAAYRQELDRIWRKVNRLGTASIADVLANPDSARNQLLRGVLTGEVDSSGPADTIYIGPNHRTFVSEGVQATLGWRGSTGPITHRLDTGARFHYDRVQRLHTEQGFLMQSGALVPDGRAELTTSNARAWAHALALHLTDAASWGPVTLTPGVRVELISTFLRDRLAARESEGAAQRIVIPGLGAYWAITPSFGLLAGAYRGFSPAAAGQSSVVQPETSINYEAGARFRGEVLRAEAIGFLNDYRNLTAVCTFAGGCSSEQVDTQYDAGRARIWGAEAFLQADIPLGRFQLPLTAAYTFTRTRLLEAFSSDEPSLGMVEIGDELPYVPRHQATGSLALEHARGGLAVGASYVAAMRESAGQGELPAGERTDESFLLELTARAALGQRGELYLILRNALDAADLASRRPFGARPIAPRWFQVGTRWRF
jgi:Fe(3+) dicitrate transport protein